MSKFHPSFDFIAGDSPPPRQPLRETFRQSTATAVTTTANPRNDIANESLRAQLNTLQYEFDSLKQERELKTLEHQSEIRDAENRAEADFKRAQAAETNANAATKKAEALARELQQAEDRSTNEKITFERKIRNLQEDNQNLREELEDVQTQLSSADRQHKHGQADLEARFTALKSSFEETQKDLESKVGILQTTQQRLSQRDAEVGNLENEILRLKAQTGDADTLAVIKRELSDQVAHIKNLETANQKQLNELKQLRKTHKSVEIVEEEKRLLQNKVRMMEDLRKELAEAQLQKQILADEKHSWTSYLESQTAENDEMKYETPQDLAKAFVAERFERMSLVDRLGAIQPELAVKEDSIRTLEDEKAKLNVELEKLKSAAAESNNTSNSITNNNNSDNKALARLQRQKNLAVKEVEYLRAQMKALEEEQQEFEPEHVDEEAKKRLQDLEGLIDQYRSEVQTLQSDLAKAEEEKAKSASSAPNPTTSLKRTHDQQESSESDERLGELRRKLRTLSAEMEKLQTLNAGLETDLKATVSQLTALRESSKTRVLEFRDNPTAQAERVKMATLNTLRAENAALLSQLEGGPVTTKVVPISTLENVRMQLSDLEATLAQRDKKQKRLKDIWTAKFLEFAEAVASVLGWRVVFLPNGRFKVTSILYPSHVNEDGDEEENSILFDGEKGTMKVSGGEKSVFANEIRPLIEFWVDGRKEIPCFLAACTLEFYERTTRAADVM